MAWIEVPGIESFDWQPPLDYLIKPELPIPIFFYIYICMLSISCFFSPNHVLVLLLLQSYMDSEIRAIMAQYMPLDSQAEIPNHVSEDRA